MSKHGRSWSQGWRVQRVRRAGGLGMLALAVAACDFEVTNPGPVQDKFLNEPTAFEAIVTGMERAYSSALGVDGFGDFAKITACVTREIFPSGNTVNHGCDPNEERGQLTPEEEDVPWVGGHNARWVAEDGIRRMEKVLGGDAAKDKRVARAYLWAAFSNRLLGENMCQAVIDGGAPEPRAVHLQRAEGQFAKAMAIAAAAGDQETEMAAIAGRASVRADLGNWSGAVGDAAKVPRDFEFQVPFFNISTDTYNFFVWGVASAPFRSVSVWNTPFEQYYLDTNDPRTPWTTDPKNPFGELARPCCGRVPFLKQLKYTKVDDPMDIADGREMLLIRAEALLREGKWPDAMQIINGLRADVGVAPWEANSVEEAWSRLKRERGIELWLEGRRMNDLRRWKEEKTPGALHALEDASNPATFLDPDQDLCFPIPVDEAVTNPNVPNPS